MLNSQAEQPLTLISHFPSFWGRISGFPHPSPICQLSCGVWEPLCGGCLKGRCWCSVRRCARGVRTSWLCPRRVSREETRPAGQGRSWGRRRGLSPDRERQEGRVEGKAGAHTLGLLLLTGQPLRCPSWGMMPQSRAFCLFLLRAQMLGVQQPTPGSISSGQKRLGTAGSTAVGELRRASSRASVQVSRTDPPGGQCVSSWPLASVSLTAKWA